MPPSKGCLAEQAAGLLGESGPEGPGIVMRHAQGIGGRLLAMAAGSAALAVLATGCASAAPAAPAAQAAPAPPATPGSKPVRATTAARQRAPAPYTRARALALAGQLLAPLAVLPGARPFPVSALPAQPGQIGQPLSPASVTVNRAGRVPQPMPQVFRYLLAHPPAGLVQGSGTGESTAGGRPDQFVTFQRRADPPGVTWAEVTVTVIARPGGGSLVAGSAEVFVYPPRSAPEDLSPAVLRVVTIRLMGTHNAVRVIRSAATVGRLVRLLDRLSTEADENFSCPVISVSYQLDFASAAGRPPAATVTTNICWVDDVAVAGRNQPPLSDPGLKLYKAVSQLLPASRPARQS
jgi:hypothetical protein